MKLYDSLVTYGLITSPDEDLLDRLVAHYSLPMDQRDTLDFYHRLAAGPSFQWLLGWLKQYGEPEGDQIACGSTRDGSSVRGVRVPDVLIAVNDPTCSVDLLHSLVGPNIAQLERLPVCYDWSANQLWIRIRFDPEWYIARGAPPNLSLLAAVAYFVEERLHETT